ncbi:MAG TPA: urease accessory protein UreD [Stellaceae bacterium]|nr:urease accessory protein UreD [Stellaceae bacterium]
MKADAPAPCLRRAEGRLALRVHRSGDATQLAGLHQESPLRALFPAVAPAAPMRAVLVNCGGGLVEGDRLSVEISVGPGAVLSVTTQAAEKIYRSIGQTCRIVSSFAVEDDALLLWLPQETILFDGARLDRRQTVFLGASARLLVAETVLFGRAARGESFATGHLHDAWRLHRDGRLVWADAIRLEGDVAAARQRNFGFEDAAGYGTIFYAGPDAPGLIDQAREVAGRHGGAATVVNAALLLRFLHEDEARLRGAVAAACSALIRAVADGASWEGTS